GQVDAFHRGDRAGFGPEGGDQTVHAQKWRCHHTITSPARSISSAIHAKGIWPKDKSLSWKLRVSPFQRVRRVLIPSTPSQYISREPGSMLLRTTSPSTRAGAKPAF